jgi:hypothetical protein
VVDAPPAFSIPDPDQEGAEWSQGPLSPQRKRAEKRSGLMPYEEHSAPGQQRAEAEKSGGRQSQRVAQPNDPPARRDFLDQVGEAALESRERKIVELCGFLDRNALLQLSRAETGKTWIGSERRHAA